MPRTASVVQIQSQEIVPIWGHHNFMEHIKEVKFWQGERNQETLFVWTNEYTQKQAVFG